LNAFFITESERFSDNRYRGKCRMNARPVVILTGASKGLGAATARWLGKIGARVALIARSKKSLDLVAKEVSAAGGKALPMVADIATAASCQTFIGNTLDQFHRIDALINNAAVISPLTPIESANIDDWEYALAVNLLAPFYLIKFALPALKDSKGRIINISSGAARTAIASASAYCVSKAGLTHLTHVLAEEVPGITTLSVRPGVVDTDMQKHLRREGRTSLKPDQFSYYDHLKKNNQLEPPEVPARSIAWLALFAPRHMNGEFRNYDDPDINAPAENIFGSSMS
jgi:NAD(P)-dependent dehydrogenase (short-subunit alcohol dehydrogenase family)